LGHKNEEEVYLPAKKAARLLGVHPVTLYRWAKKGKIRYIRTPTGRLRYPLSEIMRLKSIMGNAKDVAIYARVVDKSLVERGLLDRQIDFLRKYAEEKDYNVVEIIADVGLFNKKSIAKLFSLAMMKKICKILMVDLDRISPIFPEILEEIFGLLGVKFEIVRWTDKDLDESRKVEIIEVIEALLRRK